jgi:membrane-associated protease RseP (regulator of RpoE activity)
VPRFLLVGLAMALAALGVVLAHALGRYAFARLAKLSLERVWLRVFVRLPGPGRAGARLCAVAAGTAAAYLAVAALAFAHASCLGVPTGESTIVVGEVLDGFDAAGKLQRGDRIVAVDGEAVFAGRLPSLSQRVTAASGAPVTLTIRRAGAPLEVTIRPRQAEIGARGPWLLGVRQSTERDVATVAASAAAAAAIRAPLLWLRDILFEHATFVSGSDAPDPGGPVRIVEEFRRAFEPAGDVAWRRVLLAAAYALLLLALLDLLSAASIALERVRARKHG